MAGKGQINKVKYKPNYDTFEKDFMGTTSNNERNYLIIGVYGIGTIV